MFEPIAIMIVLIVAIVTVGDIYKKRYEHHGKVGKEELLQIQADLSELKKGVAEIREYVADLYIEKHNHDDVL